jgi:crotonobetaine/carnitine-CoA ligase
VPLPIAEFPDIPPPPVPVAPEDLALVIYTSGTTGPPKGVMLSRTAQLWHGLNYLRDFIRLGPGEVGYTPLPLFHVSAQGFTLGCLLGGAAVVVGDRFHPFSFWTTVRRHNVKAFNYVGAMVPLLYHRRPRADDADNPAERAVGSATAPELHEPFERRFGLRLIETYGQTEMAGLWLMQPEEGRRIGTVGGPRRWLEAAVLRPDGIPAALDEPGEIALRPAHPLLMTTGYFRDPEATARAFRAGWYWTGDAGSRDAEGNVRFRGRLKDFIRRRGENISAFEIEREALTHPAVREAAAVGVPAPLGEDEVKLCVIPHEGATIDPAALDRYLRPRLARFMRPRYIEVRQDFPRTSTQRIQKFKLREEGVTPGTWDRRAGRASRGSS